MPNGGGSEKLRQFFKAIMAKSKRTKRWYSLSKQDRGLYSLALRLDVSFRSVELIRALVSIVKRLRTLSNNIYTRFIRGTEMAWAFSEAAVRWGNPLAKSWRHDREYALYLGGVMGGGRWF